MYITDRTQYDPIETVLNWLYEARRAYPLSFSWSREKVPWIDYLAGTSAVRTGIDSGMTPAQVQAQWANDLAAFKLIRAKYLYYT